MVETLERISLKTINAILGFDEVPIKEADMARALSVTVYPYPEASPGSKHFLERLLNALTMAGVTIIPLEDALDGSQKPKIRPGVVVITAGQGEIGDLAIDHISDLYRTPIIGLFDGPPPTKSKSTQQGILDGIVGVLAWHMVHVPIFVEESRWTMLTMNGAVVEFPNGSDIQEDVLRSLIPKLTAQVEPPNKSSIVRRNGELKRDDPFVVRSFQDFYEGGRILSGNHSSLSHTRVDSLACRSRRYKRIVSAYLDGRSGMSYGFMAKQYPLDTATEVNGSGYLGELKGHDWEAEPVPRINGKAYARVSVLGDAYIVPVPDVWLLSTRSGCDKANMNPDHDLVRIGLIDGKVLFDTFDDGDDYRPSYDTLAMLAHAVGNSIVSSIIYLRSGAQNFNNMLSSEGMALAHWHAYPTKDGLPNGYYSHGMENPPVACSTKQSAIYALQGKLLAYELSLQDKNSYYGDIHFEPHHGTNITGSSLVNLQQWFLDVTLGDD